MSKVVAQRESTQQPCRPAAPQTTNAPIQDRSAHSVQLRKLQSLINQSPRVSEVQARMPIVQRQPVIQRVPLTRAMWSIINNTKVTNQSEYNAIAQRLQTLQYGQDTIAEILKRILENSGLQDESAMEDDSEEERNWADHGDLAEYADPEYSDLMQQEIIKAESGGDVESMQFARKGNTVSGPKSYTGANGANYSKVSYKLNAKGAIDFASYHAATQWTNPVHAGSAVDLSAAKVPFATNDRPKHFALGDGLLAKKNFKGFTKASQVANYRKGKWTWHHMPTQYDMVLVDMTVHAKHGHNGGVYLW